MLSSPSQPAPVVRLTRHWKDATAAEAAGLIRSRATVGVGWISDALAGAVADRFAARMQPRDLTIVYGTGNGAGVYATGRGAGAYRASRNAGRNHGLNLLAREGLVRRVVGGQWYPVPGLQALALANRIEAYSLPAGVINRLFRAVAEGLPGHISRSGLGTATDPRNGGGRLNRRTREQLVRLVRPAGEELLLFQGFPIDVALIGVGFMEGTAAIAMTREAMTIARAARKSDGIVIAQIDRIGTLEKLPPGQVEVPDTLVDVLVAADPNDRQWETFSSAAPSTLGQRRLTH